MSPRLAQGSWIALCRVQPRTHLCSYLGRCSWASVSVWTQKCTVSKWRTVTESFRMKSWLVELNILPWHLGIHSSCLQPLRRSGANADLHYLLLLGPSVCVCAFVWACVLRNAQFKGETCHSFASGGRRGETASEGARQRQTGRIKKEE